ncbi:MAG: hypothetical protein SPL23_01045 [Lachnospiraceae bacterium]|nr:hypothetical protein [Lachnospiraceae bacterium]
MVKAQEKTPAAVNLHKLASEGRNAIICKIIIQRNSGTDQPLFPVVSEGSFDSFALFHECDDHIFE